MREQREIKFRAWQESLKTMWWFDLTWGNKGSGDGYIGMLPIGQVKEHRGGINGGDNRWLVDPDDCELMQFTGLKDKNGKEIYEADIVQEQTSMIGHTGYISQMASGEWVFNYRRGSHPLYSPDGHENDKQIRSLLDCVSEKRIVIIGNIYESPALLTP